MTSHCALEVEHKQAAAAHVLIQCYNLTPDGNGSRKKRSSILRSMNEQKYKVINNELNWKLAL